MKPVPSQFKGARVDKLTWEAKREQRALDVKLLTEAHRKLTDWLVKHGPVKQPLPTEVRCRLHDQPWTTCVKCSEVRGDIRSERAVPGTPRKEDTL